jgi:hypothetical protein
VRLTLSSDKLISSNDVHSYINEDGIYVDYVDSSQFINDAVVVLRDDIGNSDTLQPAKPLYTYYWYDVYSNTYNQITDKNPLYRRGYYQPQKIIGTVGRTYYLEIQFNGKTYHANCKMQQTPVIDSVKYQFTQGAPGKESFYVPHIFFKDPVGEHNYYLFDFGGPSVCTISILDDANITGYVNGLDVFKGQFVDWWKTAYPMAGERFTIQMQSLTKEGYDYYKSLIQVFNNDGGTYRPAPATAPGNIDNGALGFFRATSIKKITGQIPNSNK